MNTRSPFDLCNLISGCLVVIICSIIVYFTDEQIAKFVDPVLSIVSAVLLLSLSYPYSEYILLLQSTIPSPCFSITNFNNYVALPFILPCGCQYIMGGIR
jgi:hypothetical protein